MTSRSTRSRRSCCSAIVASEDNRFYQHNGVDIQGVAPGVRRRPARRRPAGRLHADHAVRAAGHLVLGDHAAGGHRRHRGHARPQDPRDALAIALEKQLTKQFNGDEHTAKQEILDRYLNIAPFGHGAYGIYAASEVYFSEHAEGADLPQAALLAGLVQAPTELRPDTATRRASQRSTAATPTCCRAC